VRALCNRCRESPSARNVRRRTPGGREVAGVVERSWRGCRGRRGRGEVVSAGIGKFPVWLKFLF
jgi:hypothetical protein